MPRTEKGVGYKAKGGTSQIAAESDKSIIMKMCYQALLEHTFTPDELAQHLGRDKLAVRPRCSDLVKMGLAESTGRRRRNVSGKWADELKGLPKKEKPPDGFLFTVTKDGSSL